MVNLEADATGKYIYKYIQGFKENVWANKNNVENAIEALKQGKPVVVLDDYDRENEGDLILPGQKPQKKISHLCLSIQVASFVWQWTQRKHEN